MLPLLLLLTVLLLCVCACAYVYVCVTHTHTHTRVHYTYTHKSKTANLCVRVSHMPHTIMRTRTATMMCHNMLHNNNTLYIYLHTQSWFLLPAHTTHTHDSHTHTTCVARVHVLWWWWWCAFGSLSSIDMTSDVLITGTTQ